MSTVAWPTPAQSTRPLRIALVSEGTYPFNMGGVSVWCDQIMRGLPSCTFEFVALTVDDQGTALWPAPPNLERLRTIPLWTPSVPVRAPIDAEADEAVCDLVNQLVLPMARTTDRADERTAAFLDALRRLCTAARTRGSVAGMFTSDRALETLLAAWHRAVGVPMSVRDAVDWGDLLEHHLRPLQEEPVVADLVHATMNGPSMLVGMAAFWAHGTPIMLSEHGIYLRERYLLELPSPLSGPVRFLRLNFFRLLAEAAYRLASAVAPHSRYNRRWQLICGADPARVHTMYNGVELDDFPVAPEEPQTPTVVFLGRIDPVKDVQTLVRAFAHVHAAMPDALLRIFGAAAYGQEAYLRSCRALVTELGLDEVVTFEGPTMHPVDAFHAGTVVALSSISEGFPYSVVEAMACGRPVVCTNVGGVAEAVGEGGLVVTPQDPRALGEALTLVLTDDENRHRMGTAARERVIELFTVQRWVSAYAALYHSVTGTGTEHVALRVDAAVAASVAVAADQAVAADLAAAAHLAEPADVSEPDEVEVDDELALALDIAVAADRAAAAHAEEHGEQVPGRPHRPMPGPMPHPGPVPGPGPVPDPDPKHVQDGVAS